MDVGSWLRGLGLERYEAAFRQNDIAWSLVPGLTSEDLREIGVASLGHRKQLVAAITALRRTEKADEAAASGPERRYLTVMFVDLVGSTPLSAELDPEDLSSLLAAYRGRVTDIVTSAGGHVAKLVGDGILSYFGWPNAHENEAERAAQAGLDVVAAVAALDTPHGRGLAARVGIATGLVVVGEILGDGAAREEAVFGQTPNLASRLQEAARPGVVMASAATRALLGDLFAIRALGPVHLKGFGAPVDVFEIVGARYVPTRFEGLHGGPLAPMVGREQELALIEERWSRARAGEGQAVLLVGGAGIGKSRLVRAAIDAAAADDHALLRFQCSPQHVGAALWPVVRHLSQEAGIAAGDDDRAKLGRIEAFVAQTSDESGAVPLFADLLGVSAQHRRPPLDLSPAQRRARTLAALSRHALDLARRKPVLLVFEDVHWIDPSSLEFLMLTLDGIASRRLMMLLSSRPDRQPEFGAHPDVTRLMLNRLGRAAAEMIVARVGRTSLLKHDLLRDIVDRAGGVPLFIEELTKAVVDAGASRTAVPASLHASLMARLDRARGVKEVAQIASCIGREFTHDLLAAVSTLAEDDLAVALDRLMTAELVFRRPGAEPVSYVFKHALVRDAAHESLLRETRRQLHRRILEALEAGRPDLVRAEPELLAEHCAEAGLVEKEAEHRLAAGRRSLTRSATAEAIGQLELGLSALTRFPAGPARDTLELRLQLALGQASIAARGFAAEATGEAYARAHTLCVATGNVSELAPVLYGRSVFHFQRGEIDRALALAEELLDFGRAQGDGGAEIAGHRMCGSALSQCGAFARSRASFETAVALCEKGLDGDSATVYAIDSLAMSLGWLSQLELQLGRAESARARHEAAVRRARRVGHANTTAVTHVWSAIYFQLCGDGPRALAEAADAIDLAETHAYPLYRAAGSVLYGWATAQAGRAEDGVMTLRKGLVDYTATGAVMWSPYFLGLLAEAEGWTGDATAGLAALDEALLSARGAGVRWIEAHLLRLRGDILAAAAHPDLHGAEICYGEAMRVADGQGAHLWRLRAAIRLAGLWEGTGAAERRRALLEPIIAHFPEPPDPSDTACAEKAMSTP